tara:strand:- start:256 stop:423 length:168 start_codon:yes stop_codon:yes gene_type:complete
LLVVDVVEVELELPDWYVVLEVLVYPPVMAVFDPVEFTWSFVVAPEDVRSPSAIA